MNTTDMRLSDFTLAELLAMCGELVPDFKLEEVNHPDPRTPKVPRPLVRASGTIAGRPLVLELIVTPAAIIAGARTLDETRRSVVEGFYRTIRRST